MKTAAKPVVKKPAKGVIPAGFANGGKVAKPFAGKDAKGEEVAEAKSVRGGKLPPKGYAAKETVEEKREGEKTPRAALLQKGKDLASGKLSASQYGAQAKMANGGKVKKGC